MLQVLEAKEEELFVLFTCWGRIGDMGQFQKTPFCSKEAAVEEFCKIFKAKTGNEWSKRKEYAALQFFVHLFMMNIKRKKYYQITSP